MSTSQFYITSKHHATRETPLHIVGLKAGILTCLGLVAYFLLMKYLKLIHITELRGFNFVILATGIVRTFRYVQHRMPFKLNYFQGFGLSCLVAAVSVVSFAVFVYIYFLVLDPALLLNLKANSPMMGNYITPFTAAGSVLVEGICSGLVISFCYMQYFQDRFKP